MLKSIENIGEQSSDKEIEEQLVPEGSLAEARKKFGTLLVDAAGSTFQQNYQSRYRCGDRILINTTAEGIRGPKIGKAHSTGKEGTAFIDLALTPESAQRLYKQLGCSLEDWEQSQKK